MTHTPNIRIGCSGYYYRSWKGNFYPEKLPPVKWLQYYSSVFNTVELNGTFYRVPKLSDLNRYASFTPHSFTFSVKVSRYITHVLKLKETASRIAEFKQLMEDGLQHKLDKLLFQLPPSFKCSEENLETLLSNIPPSAMHVIEFRDISWWHNPQAIAALGGYTFCNVDYPGIQEPFIHTSKDFYLRMHGVPELFKSKYSNLELRNVSDQIPKELDSYHIYFNNTYYDAAYLNAQYLKKLLERRF